MSIDVLKNLRATPEPGRAIENYRRLAPAYESSCTRVQALRELAVQRLGLMAGETVFDLACGTGATLSSLSRAVGPDGLVVGVEQCPEMAGLARQRIATLTTPARTTIVQGAVEAFEPDARADAVLMCFAHDVLQSPAALQRLLAIGKPGARVVLLGLRTLPWWWAWPLNLFNLFRARRYLTTYAGMARPWQLLASRGAAFEVTGSALWGSIYIAVGRLPMAGGDDALGVRLLPTDPIPPASIMAQADETSGNHEPNLGYYRGYRLALTGTPATAANGPEAARCRHLRPLFIERRRQTIHQRKGLECD